MSEGINHHRRCFLGTAAMTVAAARLGMIGSAQAQANEASSASLSSIKPWTDTSFGALKQIDAGVLNVGYAEAGPAGSYAKKFSGKYAHRVVRGGAGHNLPQEAPHEFAQAVIDVDGF